MPGAVLLEATQQRVTARFAVWRAHACVTGSTAREAVDKALSALGEDAMSRLQACTQALAMALIQTKDVLSRLVATTLALETVNGMAKTAPMTRAAMMMLMDKARAGSSGAAV